MATMNKSRTSPVERTPLAEAALRLGMNRERLLRRVQSGDVPGFREDGYWFVDLTAIEAVAA